mmetsp:Transcript_11481/g.27955  ORF Transcript_11481/g.27955 Transcript_11481/m.27955 type:complete len:85 (-) Transcript_11481:71-325(-)
MAQAGKFLPPDFRFGKTDNRLMEDMNHTLQGMSAAAAAQAGTSGGRRGSTSALNGTREFGATAPGAGGTAVPGLVASAQKLSTG